MAALQNSADRDIESQEISNQSRKDSETYQSTILPASAIDFDPEPHKRLFRQFANPAPLGLCGFALTTFVLSLTNVHARSVAVPNIVIGLGITFLMAFSNISFGIWWSCTILCWNVGIRIR
jgi:succinate-acetate transporter protein